MSTSKSFKIRKAVKGDFKAVNDLYYSTYSSYHKNLPESYKITPSNLLSSRDFLNMLTDENSFIRVAMSNDLIIGFIYAYTEKEEDTSVSHGYDRVCIAEISITPNYQRQGVGSQLIKEVEKWAKDRKLSDLVVLVYNFNKKAANFYEKQGYKPYSTQFTKKLK